MQDLNEVAELFFNDEATLAALDALGDGSDQHG